MNIDKKYRSVPFRLPEGTDWGMLQRFGDTEHWFPVADISGKLLTWPSEDAAQVWLGDEVCKSQGMTAEQAAAIKLPFTTAQVFAKMRRNQVIIFFLTLLAVLAPVFYALGEYFLGSGRYPLPFAPFWLDLPSSLLVAGLGALALAIATKIELKGMPVIYVTAVTVFTLMVGLVGVGLGFGIKFLLGFGLGLV